MNETRFDPWLARILITELLWGKKRLAGDAKPIQTILSYETKLKSILDKLIESKEIIKPKKGKFIYFFIITENLITISY